jgi:transposase
MTILAAIGEIHRFPTPMQLVGYIGLGSRVQDSSKSYSTERITKTGQRDLRRAMVAIANHTILDHAHWRAKFESMSAHIGCINALVSITRKLLLVV